MHMRTSYHITYVTQYLLLGYKTAMVTGYNTAVPMHFFITMVTGYNMQVPLSMVAIQHSPCVCNIIASNPGSFITMDDFKKVFYWECQG